jgi:pimeloyl-ACP methyl ester carboxylesterase
MPLTSAQATSAAAAIRTRENDFSGLVDIGVRELYLECRGAGRPTVILEAGYRCDARTWSGDEGQPEAPRQMVFPAVAEFTHVCAYDRPGTLFDVERRGRSDLVPMPRTAADAVDDLRALLTAAGVPGPYVLVGHSYGGVLVRLFAARYPDEVVGVVLVDASHENQNARYAAVVAPEERGALARLDELLPPELEDDATLERFDFAASSAQVREAVRATPLPALPLIVLSRGRSYADDDPAEWEGISVASVEALERERQAMQRELAVLSPDGTLVIAHNSGHFVQSDEPELVIAAVREVVDAARARSDQADTAPPASMTAAARPLIARPTRSESGS